MKIGLLLEKFTKKKKNDFKFLIVRYHYKFYQ